MSTPQPISVCRVPCVVGCACARTQSLFSCYRYYPQLTMNTPILKKGNTQEAEKPTGMGAGHFFMRRACFFFLAASRHTLSFETQQQWKVERAAAPQQQRPTDLACFAPLPSAYRPITINSYQSPVTNQSSNKKKRAGGACNNECNVIITSFFSKS